MTGFDQIEHACLTDVGVRRSHNQDAYAVLLAADLEQWNQRGHVFLVADGMGAHAVGELASELAANIIPHTYNKHVAEGAGSALRKAFVEANASIHARGQQNQEFKGMGTTSTALVLDPKGAWVGHVGDSRVYRVRNRFIEQLSFDHSLVWEMARRQGVKPSNLPGIPTNVIVRSLGPEPLVQVDVEGPHPIEEGDVFLLCSDGLSGLVSDQEIGIAARSLPPAEGCRFLVDLAILRGGHDNITVLIARVPEPKNANSPTPGKVRSRSKRVSFSTIVLCLGVFIALTAVSLAVLDWSGAVPSFILALLFLLAGLVGLIVGFSRDQPAQFDETEKKSVPNIYGQTSCAVTPTFLTKLNKGRATLEKYLREKNAEVDWDVIALHQKNADEFLRTEKWDDAFREISRGLLPLSQGLHRHRRKEEVFQPVWDKKTD